MANTDDSIAESLLRESEEFRRAREQHERLERILEEFNRRPHLTADEEMERKKIQKLKLVGKDRMERMLFAHRKALVARVQGEAS